VETFCSPYTINLSGKPLSQDSIKLLDLGLTFIPTIQEVLESDIKTDVDVLIRKLKLTDYFDNRPGKDIPEDQRRFTEKSDWTPAPNAIRPACQAVISDIIKDISEIIDGKRTTNKRNQRCIKIPGVRDNLTPDLRLALKEFRANKEIIIKPADKGGAVVVMSRELYINEALRQLTNTFYYRELEYPIFFSNVKKLNDILMKMQREGYINRKQFLYLEAKETHKQRYFYMLPKVHKNRDKWPNLNMPDGRPIVADCGSESYRISEYIDYFLKPVSISHESYLKDTFDFIHKIRDKPIEKDWLLVTGDVTALYTNMKIEIMLETVREAFAAHPVHNRPDAHILQLLEITLRGNDFEFNGRIFLQIVGTAMGKRYAPNLANLYLRKLDHKAKHAFRIKPEYYFRFLDDVHFLWPGDRDSLTEYGLFLNSLIPGITITLTVRDVITEFLDTRIMKHCQTDGTWVLNTMVYFKPTDTHQLLHISSAHPKHTCKGIIKSQFIRFKRLCSNKMDFDNASRVLWHTLKNRGYSHTQYRTLKNEVWRGYDCSKRKNEEKKEKVLPIVTFFDPINYRINRAARRILGKDTFFVTQKIISAYKIHANLHRLLIRNSKC